MLKTLIHSTISFLKTFVILFTLIQQLVFSFSMASDALSEKEHSKIEWGCLPLLFEKNEGQADPSVLYLSQGTGCTSYFRAHDLLFLLKKETGQGKSLFLPVKMEFVDVSPLAALPRGEEEQECKSHYFIGNNPQEWKTSLSNYAKVRYETIYPGIDFLFYGNPQQLKYDILISPGANPERIRLRFQGIDSLSITPNGELCLNIFESEELLITKPFIYQIDNKQQVQIDGKFVLLNKKEVGFSLGDYDLSRPLIIDPSLVYSTYLGGNLIDSGNAIAVDVNGNAYVTGGTTSTTFPTTAGAFQPALYPNAQNAFISKINSTGTSLIYSTYLGGDNLTSGNGITLDNEGMAYVTGGTTSNNFPTTINAYQPSLGGNGAQNAFITKLNQNGQALVYSTYLGGDGADDGRGIALDADKHAYVTGSTSPSLMPPNTFPTTPGAFQTVPTLSTEAFISKLSVDGQSLVYSTYLGGNNFDQGNSIAVDSSGYAYVTGNTLSNDFPTTLNAFQSTLNGTQNAFVTKMNMNGTALVYSSYLGGNEIDEGNGIAIDNQGNAYLTGSTDSETFPTTPNAFQQTLSNDKDAFITKFNSTGSALIYSTYLGGNGDDTGNGIAIDSAGNAYVTGSTFSTNFPTTLNAFQTTLSGGIGSENAFITKLNSEGSALLYSSYFGGGPNDIGHGIALDSKGDAYLTGQTNSASFPITPGVLQSGLNGTQNAFIGKFAIGTPHIFTIDPHQGPSAGGTIVVITGENFDGTTAVFFGAIPATFIVDSDTQITATSPPGSGTVDVTVRTPLGTSPRSSADLFTYFKQFSITTLSACPNPAECGESVTLRATVRPSSIKGTLSFFDGPILLGTLTLVNQAAEMSVDNFSPGAHHLTAVYHGDSDHFSSTSLTVRLFISKSPECEVLYPPIDLKGKQIVNRFATQTDFINFISWKVPGKGTPVVAYEIYRDRSLKNRIGIVPNNEKLQFADHHRKKRKAYRYFIVSVDALGNHSDPTKLTIKNYR